MRKGKLAFDNELCTIRTQGGAFEVDSQGA